LIIREKITIITGSVIHSDPLRDAKNTVSQRAAPWKASGPKGCFIDVPDLGTVWYTSLLADLVYAVFGSYFVGHQVIEGSPVVAAFDHF
jgi:hypothetical protein